VKILKEAKAAFQLVVESWAYHIGAVMAEGFEERMHELAQEKYQEEVEEGAFVEFELEVPVAGAKPGSGKAN
jgi:hypothetical protein